MKHEDAMALLGGEKDGIVKVKGQFDEAIASPPPRSAVRRRLPMSWRGNSQREKPSSVARRNKNAGVE